MFKYEIDIFSVQSRPLLCWC